MERKFKPLIKNKLWVGITLAGTLAAACGGRGDGDVERDGGLLTTGPSGTVTPAASLELSPITPTSLQGEIGEECQSEPLVWRYPIIKDGILGLMDETGKVILFPEFDEVSGYFYEGLAPIRDGAKWGYVNLDGQVVIPPQFDGKYGYDFSEGLAVAQMGDKKGFIDHSGRFVIEPQFDFVDPFRECLAAVGFRDPQDPFGNTYIEGYIDRQGNMVIEPRFTFATSFSQGVALVSENGDLWGFIDKEGNYIVVPRFTIELNQHVFDPLADLVAVKVGDNWGYIDRAGMMVIPPSFEQAGTFDKGLADIQIGGLWGFIDEEGKEVIKPQFLEVYGFTEGIAAVKMEAWGYYDANFNRFVTLDYSSIDLNQEFIVPPTIIGVWGYIDTQDQLAIHPIIDSRPRFGEVGSFNEGLAAVSVYDTETAKSIWGYIDKTGQFVIEPQFDRAESFYLGYYAKVFRGGACFWINRQGQILAECP